MARCKQPSYSRNNTSTPCPPPCGHEAPPYSSTRSQPVRIEDCDVRRERTSPPGHCGQTPVTWRRTQSSITKYVLDTERSLTPDTSPPAEDAHSSNGPSNRPGTPRTHHRARGLHPWDQSSAPMVRPRGPAGQDHHLRTRASVKAATRAPVRATTPHMSGSPRTPPAKCLPRLNRQPPFPFPGVPEPAAPQPQESPSLWRNVGPILGSVRRLTEGLPKALWAIPMGLLDPTSNMWGVRHHDSPPVSEWCS